MISLAMLKDWFDAEDLIFLGVVRPEEPRSFAAYEKWLKEGRHAGMHYMAQNVDKRQHPATILPGAKRVVCFGLSYFQGRDDGTKPRLAQYARLKDYHKVMKEKGERILARIHGGGDETHVGRVFVDTAPLLERALAQNTNVGFVGKNTLFIHETFGSFLHLGEIFTSADLPLSENEAIAVDQRTRRGGCGSCRRCQVHCPTGALDENYVLDANRCLSYWTIEHRGTIPEEFWPWLGRFYFGCDMCQLVCPYNRGAAPSAIASQLKRAEPDLFEVATMDQVTYERLFGGSPATRAKRHGLRRNALIALAVTDDHRLKSALSAIDDEDESVLHETRIQIERYRGCGERRG